MRNINKIIIHCSATPEGRHTTVADIKKWHLQRGFTDIGYHYVIYIDGSLHDGRPIEQAGAHTQGYNSNSIGICYVGGMTADNKIPKDTRTLEQRATLKDLIITLKLRFPRATIHGHNEFANKACPSFDVQKENWI
jgi:N-acetylmuramoyl-L-alanine amidase